MITALKTFYFSLAEEKKNAGNDQYKAQNYRHALQLYCDAIAFGPETAIFYGNRAACYMILGHYNAALMDLRYSIHLDCQYEKSYVRIAKCCLALGDVIATEQAITKLQEIAPNSLAIAVETQKFNQLQLEEDTAMTFYLQGEHDRCLCHVNNALELATACLRFKLLNVECLVMLRRIGQARALADQCIKADSLNAEAVFVRGLCLYYDNNLDKGLEHFELALRLDPDNSKARLMWYKAKQLREKKETGEWC